MLNKVLKKMSEEEKKKAGIITQNNSYQNLNDSQNTGFHAKANSEAGASRQRSMGNRLVKPSNKV